MIVSGSGRNSFEQIFANMWLRSSGLTPGGTLAHHVNMRGMGVSLDLNFSNGVAGTTLDVPLGQSCLIGGASAAVNGIQATGMGICASDLVVGVDFPQGPGSPYRVNKWILVQIYGHAPRIVGTLVTTANDIYFGLYAQEDGPVQTWSRADLDAPMTLTGTATVNTGGASAVINLAGIDTATATWGGVPPVVSRGTQNERPAPSDSVLGYKYLGAPVTVPEAPLLDGFWAGILREFPGFVTAMGISPRG